MKITYLSEHSDLIPTLARWLHAQFSYLAPAASEATFAVALAESCGRRMIPTTVVALSDGALGERAIPAGTLLGTASLVARDLPSHVHLSPWLADVYVAPGFRRQGVGGALVQRIAEEARGLGRTALYLYTPDQMHFYEGLGWSQLERVRYLDYEVTVMALSLAGERTEPAHGRGGL